MSAPKTKSPKKDTASSSPKQTTQSHPNVFRPYKAKAPLSAKEISILAKIDEFFSHKPSYIKIMLDIIDIKTKSDISLRVLDWFVTNYSKHNNIYYKCKIGQQEDIFYVHHEYDKQLKGYQKHYFDPCCRAPGKVIYEYGEKPVKILTSIGQLNFFRWAIKYKVINYVRDNLEEIETDMKKTNRDNKARKIQESLENSISAEAPTDQEDSDEEFTSSNKMVISSTKKSNPSSEKKFTRKQLTKSVYDHGIKRTDIPISLTLDFH